MLKGNRAGVTEGQPKGRPTRLCLIATLLATFAYAGSPRFARLGSFEGSVEVQLDAADSWRPATANLPLPESTRIRTGPAAKVEIELDDSSVLRLAGEGLAELTDYTRLSGGQLITVLSLDHGLAYFTGEPGSGNAIHLLVPGAQVSPKQGCRIRLQALDASSEIAIIEGATRFAIPSAEMDLRQGQSAHVTVPDSTQFSLSREITPMEADRWSEHLDQAEAQAPASRLDLDHAGKWITAGDYGTVWQPAPQAGWAPFRQGRWIWFQSVGFTWVGAESWGWKPYHEGRWLQHSDLGWVWVPPVKSATFSPGDVFWARGTNIAAWGPLAPGEQWNATGPARQFAALNVTAGTCVAGAREILPSSAEELPKDLLKSLMFTAALPSPPLPLSRLNASRSALRTRLYSAVDVTPAYPEITEAIPPPQTDSEPLADVAPPPVQPAPSPSGGDPNTPPDGIYPAMVYNGIVVVNLPEKGGVSSGTKTTPALAGSLGSKTGSGGSSSTPPITTATHRNLPEPRPEHVPEKAPPVEIHRIEAKSASVNAAPVVAAPIVTAPAVRVEAKSDSTIKSK